MDSHRSHTRPRQLPTGWWPLNDIETTGLDPRQDRITTACHYGAMDGQRLGQRVTREADAPGTHVIRTFVFKSTTSDSDKEDLKMREEFVDLLDSVRGLCTFNGIRFDIPFLQKAWGIPSSRVEAWIVKTFDVYEACKLGLNATFPLDRLLAANSLESKTGSGPHANQLDTDGKWKELGDYCMQDTHMTYLVSSQQAIAPPLHTVQGKKIVIDRGRPTLSFYGECSLSLNSEAAAAAAGISHCQ